MQIMSGSMRIFCAADMAGEATGVKANVDTIKGDVGDMKQVDRLVWNLIPRLSTR